MVTVGITNSGLLLKIRTRLLLPVHGEIMPIELPFGLCNASATFQRAILGIFFDLIHDSVEVNMDEFTIYGDIFHEAISNLEKFLIKCQETKLALSHEKCKMLLTEGIVLEHHILANGIQVDPTKIEVMFGLSL